MRIQLLPRWLSQIETLPMWQRPKMVFGESIYMAQMDPELRPNRIKAGFSINLASRWLAYRTSSPNVQFIAIAAAGKPAETELLQRLEAVSTKVIGREVFDFKDVDRALLIFAAVTQWWKAHSAIPAFSLNDASDLIDVYVLKRALQCKSTDAATLICSGRFTTSIGENNQIVIERSALVEWLASEDGILWAKSHSPALKTGA